MVLFPLSTPTRCELSEVVQALSSRNGKAMLREVAELISRGCHKGNS